ncbi:unnamed protein product [Polarella glacialis]|uniref:Phosphoglycerate mutase n=1 Tax=Polarella glacialis TaxID=89957 RepID=A0A813JLI2_POLGL|nr:unnamed protein product [Polarella glacialis]CAE8680026.1 unnamed protein product [Polarella glacialis]
MPSCEREPAAQAEDRGRRSLDWILRRPETTIAVVSHEWMLRAILDPSRNRLLKLEKPSEAVASSSTSSRLVNFSRFGLCELRAFTMRAVLSPMPASGKSSGFLRVAARPLLRLSR